MHGAVFLTEVVKVKGNSPSVWNYLYGISDTNQFNKQQGGVYVERTYNYAGSNARL